jgi:hypothetical protein
MTISEQLRAVAEEAGIYVTYRTTEADLMRAFARQAWWRIHRNNGFEDPILEPVKALGKLLADLPLSDDRRTDLIMKHREVRDERTKKDSMWFSPDNGICWSCGQDIVDEGWERGDVTGCPKCNRSYCD